MSVSTLNIEQTMDGETSIPPTEVERPSPPPDTALALRQATAGTIKKLQANGMKPTIIEDSESDEDAITKAREDLEDNVQNEDVMKSMQVRWIYELN